MNICGINCIYNNETCKVANEVPEEYNYNNDPDCYFYSFNYDGKESMIQITNITKAYLFGIKIVNKYYLSENPYVLKPTSGQTIVVYYSPTIIKQIISKYAYGLAGGKADEYVDFNVHTDVTTSTASEVTTLTLQPASSDIYYQEETYNLNSIISNIGGFYSSLSGIFAFLFGASKLAPWGFLQTNVFNCLCTRYRRKLVRKLKNKYEPIPFVSGRAKNFTLEERVQSIENLLGEYYLNTEFLNELLEDNGEAKV
ncbi:hypothetical protein RclHR1_03390004 [Rhizophagus clarus]|nr:hypothetical protein RclHR1_03390004 [Rhizophagus clarus]